MLRIIQLWLNYFMATFLKALDVQFSGVTTERTFLVASAFSFVSLVVYGDYHLSLPVCQ